MEQIPNPIKVRYDALLAQHHIPEKSKFHYLKWLRYYLDFCRKYHFKKSEKKPYQTKERQPTKASWVSIYNDLKSEIKIRHYSPSTLKTYTGWAKQFQNFTKSKDPRLLADSDVKDFLTHLAVNRKAAASTQNQAFNALLFFFRHVIKNEFGDLKDIPRAKRKPYIPVVLSREEIDAIIANLKYPYDLIVKLLYGCVLRLFECMNLRVNDFYFDTSILTVHDARGKKTARYRCLKKSFPTSRSISYQ